MATCERTSSYVVRQTCARLDGSEHVSNTSRKVSMMVSSPMIGQPHVVERGSSVGRMPDSQSREPGFESPLLPFRSLGIFFHFTTPQSTQLYK